MPVQPIPVPAPAPEPVPNPVSCDTPLFSQALNCVPLFTSTVVVSQGLSSQKTKGGVLVPHVGGDLGLKKDKCESFTSGSNLQGDCVVTMQSEQ